MSSTILLQLNFHLQRCMYIYIHYIILLYNIYMYDIYYIYVYIYCIYTTIYIVFIANTSIYIQCQDILYMQYLLLYSMMNIYAFICISIYLSIYLSMIGIYLSIIYCQCQVRKCLLSDCLRRIKYWTYTATFDVCRGKK